jgi:hypothetical protein
LSGGSSDHDDHEVSASGLLPPPASLGGYVNNNEAATLPLPIAPGVLNMNDLVITIRALSDTTLSDARGLIMRTKQDKKDLTSRAPSD